MSSWLQYYLLCSCKLTFSFLVAFCRHSFM